jgi:hypothetical protein
VARKKKSKAAPSTGNGEESPIAEGAAGTDQGPEKPTRESATGEKRAARERATKKKATKKKATKKKAAKKKAAKKKAAKQAPKKQTPKKQTSKKTASKGEGAEEKESKEAQGKAPRKDEAEGEAPKEKAAPTKTTKRKTPKKKRARRKAAKKAEGQRPGQEQASTGEAPPEEIATTEHIAVSEPGAVAEAETSSSAPTGAEAPASSQPDPLRPTEPDDEPPVEVIDEDEDAAETVEGLIAELSVSVPDAGATQGPGTSLDVEVDEVGTVEDLDDDLDEDEITSDAVGRLIAETLAAAKAEELEPEPAEPPSDLAESLRRPSVDVAPPGAPQEAIPGGESEGPSTAQSASEREGSELEVTSPAERGAVSTPEFRGRLLAEALAHAEHRDARYRVPFSDAARINRWKSLIASLVFLIALVAGMAPPAWVRPVPPAPLSRAERARGIRQALLLQAQQVEAYRVRSHRLPATLDELSMKLPGLRYTRSGNRAFQLVAYEPDGNAIVYDSSNPAPPFRALTRPGTSEDGTR